jgi:hypothetical protein
MILKIGNVLNVTNHAKLVMNLMKIPMNVDLAHKIVIAYKEPLVIHTSTQDLVCLTTPFVVLDLFKFQE